MSQRNMYFGFFDSFEGEDWTHGYSSWFFFFFFPQMRIGNFVYGQSWWWTGKPGMLQSMGSQRVGYDWATELNWAYDKRLQVCCREFHTGHGHAQREIFQLSFLGDKMRSAAWETAPQIALRDYSKEEWGEVNISDFGEEGGQCHQGLILQKVFC